jgi:hypothetical protein
MEDKETAGKAISAAKKMALTETIGRNARELAKQMNMDPFDTVDCMMVATLACIMSVAKDGSEADVLEGFNEVWKERVASALKALEEGVFDLASDRAKAG